MAKLWAKIIVKHRIARQATVDCAFEDAPRALTELCTAFDIPNPMWLGKHEREYARFGRTSFLPDHFVEAFPYQKLEIEFLEDDAKPRKSGDPRNAF
ncbi:MAG: hypothetical protein ACOYI5_08725 [Christensenellales bacterium]